MDTTGLVLQVRDSAWATRRVLESVNVMNCDEFRRDLGSSYGGIYGTLAHIFQADCIWFDRLEGVSTTNLAAYEPDRGLYSSAFSGSWLAVLSSLGFLG